MIVNLKFAARYLVRNCGKTVPRIISLTLGLTLALFLLSYVNYRFNYDNFLPDKERIYKIFYNEGTSGGIISECTPGPLAESLMNDCPEVEYAARMYGAINTLLFRDDQEYSVTAYAVDSLFFKVLDYGLMTGDDNLLSTDEDKVFLSEEKAGIIFRDENPVGKVILDNMKNPKSVAGVFRDIPYNTSLGRFDLLLPICSLSQNLDNWDSSTAVQTYVKLREGASAKNLENWLNGAMISKYKLEETYGKTNARYIVVPVKRAEVMVGTRRQYMDFFTALSILVMALCALNYALLSISSLVDRSRTIAVMRCTSAEKKDIRSQFLWETFLLMLVSSVISVLIIKMFSNEISSAIEGPVASLFSLKNIWVSLCVVLFLFTASGLIPATVFASVPINVAFKGMSDNKKGWKRFLLVFETVCISFSSAFLAVSVLQISQLQSGSLGFNPRNLVYVSLMVRGGDALFNAESDFESLSCVESAGTSYCLPMYAYGTAGFILDEDTHEAVFQYCEDYVSDSYFETMGIAFFGGDSFRESGADNEIVVNRAFLAKAGWDESAIGRNVLTVGLNGETTKVLRIIAVVDNVRTNDNGAVSPMVYHSIRQCIPYSDNRYGGFRTMLRLNEVNENTIAEVSDKLLKYDSIDNRSITIYYDAYLNRMRGEIHFRQILLIIFIICSIISIIGLIGYFNDELRRRRRETALRIISGATLRDILVIFWKDFIKLAVPAVLTGEILAFAASRLWLRMFEYRIQLSFWIFFLTGTAVLSVILAVECLFCIKAANANPIDSFRTE